MSIEPKTLKDAIKELREKSAKRNFNQTIELIINLKDIDMKQPEGRIQERIELPHTLGKKVSVCVLADGDMALRARRGGADMVLESSEIQGLSTDKKRQRQIAKMMDVFISSAPLMPLVGRALGGILGPRGKMPVPIPPTANIEQEIERQKRFVLVRARNQPILQCRIGTENMSDDEIAENVQTIIRRVTARLKKGIKNVDAIYLKTTMGHPVKISV
ncbi:50S ribosomal protein L1 [Candidatus Bathyarchaeota archaeon]|nr:50S ribosomal protein L1 [Candidatus Bathyarchaeota archaeon]